MKKTLVIAALVGLVAAPAFAGLAPLNITPIVVPAEGNVTLTSLDGTPRDGLPGGGQLAGYKPNDPANMYDNMWGDPFGPLLGGPAQYNAGSSPYLGGGTFVFDDIHVPQNDVGYWTATTLRWLWYNPGAIGNCQGGVQNVTVLFFSNTASNGTLGATIVGYQFTGVQCGFFIGQFSIPPTQLPKDAWIGIRHATPGVTQVLGSAGSHVDGDAATGSGSLPGAQFQGTGGSAMWFFDGASFFTSSAGKLMLTITGTKIPEPATIGFLALGGLLVLRRRKA